VRIFVTLALEAEFVPWRRVRRFREASGGGIREFQAEADGAEVRVVLTGAGRIPAQRAMEKALGSGADVCIASGVAGGLRTGQRVGEILAARRSQELSSQRIRESDARLFEEAVSAGARAAEMFCTAHYVLAKAEDKQRMGRIAEAVDMETFHVMEAAGERGIPCVAVRALSDLAEEDLAFDFSAMMNSEGNVNYGRLAARVAMAPQRLPGLLRLGRQTRLAAGELARFLETFIGRLAGAEAENGQETRGARAASR
jgi:adenosylhomocysteine nucleosidase